MSVSWPWSVLGLPGPTDERAVKKAYALRLRQIDRQNAEEFQQLRKAYDLARSLARDANRHGAVSRKDPRFNGSGQQTRKRRPSEEDLPVNPERTVTVHDMVQSEGRNPEWDWKPDGEGDSSLSERDDSSSHSLPDFAVLVRQIKNSTFDKKEVDHFKSILDQLLADYPQRKDYVEDVVMGVLSEKMSHDSSFVLSKEYIAFFEDHFKWASDGVRFLKKARQIDASGLLSSSITKRSSDFLFFTRKHRSGWVSFVFLFPLDVILYGSFFLFLFVLYFFIFVLDFLVASPDDVSPENPKFRKVFSISVYKNDFGNFVLWLRGFLLFLTLCQISVWWTDRNEASNIDFDRWTNAIFLFVAFMCAVRISSEILSRASIILIRFIRDARKNWFVFDPDALTDTWRPTSESWWLWIHIAVLFVVLLLFSFLGTSPDLLN